MNLHLQTTLKRFWQAPPRGPLPAVPEDEAILDRIILDYRRRLWLQKLTATMVGGLGIIALTQLLLRFPASSIFIASVCAVLITLLFLAKALRKTRCPHCRAPLPLWKGASRRTHDAGIFRRSARHAFDWRAPVSVIRMDCPRCKKTSIYLLEH